MKRAFKNALFLFTGKIIHKGNIDNAILRQATL